MQEEKTLSRCRCEEIAYCQRQIVELNDVSNLLNACSKHFEEIATSLGQLSVYCNLAYSSNRAESVSTAIKSLDDDMVSAKAKLHQKVIDKKTQLANWLAQIENEDEEYHMEETKENAVVVSHPER